MEMFCICAVKYGSRQSHVAIEYLKCGESELRYSVCIQCTHLYEKHVKYLISAFNIDNILKQYFYHWVK